MIALALAALVLFVIAQALLVVALADKLSAPSATARTRQGRPSGRYTQYA